MHHSQLVLRKLSIAAFVAAYTLFASADNVLKWIGGVDSNLTTPGNWEGGDISALSDTANGAVLDLTGLSEGTLVNNASSAAKLCLKGVTLAANSEVTLSGGVGFRMLANCQFTVPPGSVLNIGMKHPNPWADDNTSIIISGGGQVRVTTTSDFNPYNRTFKLMSGSTFAWASSAAAKSGMEMATVSFAENGAKLSLEKDLRVGGVSSADGVLPDIELNGHTLRITSGENKAVSSLGGIVGAAGDLAFAGGSSNLLAKGTISGINTVKLYNTQVVVSDGILSGSPNVNVYAAGVMSFEGDAQIGSLGGTGISGGLGIAEGNTLSVTEGGVYPAMIYGAGSVAVDGGELTLSGRNTYVGSTQVKQGSLTVDSGAAAKDASVSARLSFDDPNDILANTAPSADVISMGKEKKAPTAVQNGAVGGAAKFAAADDTTYSFAANSVPVKTVAGGNPFTVSFWTRNPSVKSSQSSWLNMAYLLESGQWAVRQHLNMYLHKSGNFGFSAGNDWNQMNSGTETDYTFLTKLPNGYFGDGKWHHVAYVYSQKTMTIYVDATNSWSKTFGADLAFSASNTLYVFGQNDTTYIPAGEFDEMEFVSRALTAEEVASCATFAEREIVDPARLLPLPLAHWDFNDESDPGKDSVGGFDLKNTSEAGGFSLYSDSRTYGKALVTGSSKIYTFKDGYPLTFPSGAASFTVSIRFRADAAGENTGIFGWGDSAANSCFQVGITSCPRQLVLFSSASTVSDWLLADERFCRTGSSAASLGGWVHLVFTYDAATGYLTAYRDGTSVFSTTKSLAIGGTSFFLGSRVTGASSAGAVVDDLQVFDRVLSATQVGILTRSLETGDAGPVLPADSPITVSSGATLNVKGDNHSFASLSGAGAVKICASSSFTLHGFGGFTGSVGGAGEVRIGSGGSLKGATVSSPVRIEADSVVQLADCPLAETAGELYLPQAATVVADSAIPGTYEIARGAKSVRGGEDLSGWTVQGLEPSRYRFSVKDGSLLCKIKGGLLMIVE